MSKYDVKQEVTDKFSLRGRVFHKLREDILSGKYQEHEELVKEIGMKETGILVSCSDYHIFLKLKMTRRLFFGFMETGRF